MYLVWHRRAFRRWRQTDGRELTCFPTLSRQPVRRFKMPNASIVGRVTNAWLALVQISFNRQADIAVR